MCTDLAIIILANVQLRNRAQKTPHVETGGGNLEKENKQQQLSSMCRKPHVQLFSTEYHFVYRPSNYYPIPAFGLSVYHAGGYVLFGIYSLALF
jgi:hypothetical protein